MTKYRKLISFVLLLVLVSGIFFNFGNSTFSKNQSENSKIVGISNLDSQSYSSKIPKQEERKFSDNSFSHFYFSKTDHSLRKNSNSLILPLPYSHLIKESSFLTAEFATGT